MGSLRHPAGDRCRDAFAKREYSAASTLLEEGLRESPANPDLACESAILSVFRAQEEQAFELLPICEGGLRFDYLTSLLADHFTSRILADRTDHDARKRLQLVRSFHPRESKHIGVKICACLIVKNEEKTLERCLKSLVGKVDQMVVVDTGSTDTTVEIAMAFGARVAHFQWCDDFAAARNYALSFATAHWILSIDADEELTAETKSALDRAVIRPQFGGFDIDIVNFLDDANTRSQFCHCPTRLFRNLPGVKFIGRIHEQVNPSLAKLNLAWARLDGATILHYGYQNEAMVEKSKIERTISLLRRELDEDATNSFQWFNLANAYLVGGRYSEASDAAKSAVQLLTSASGFAVPSYSILLQALQALGEYDQAVAYSDEAIAKGFDCLQIAFEKCGALISSGRFLEADRQSEHMMGMEWAKGSTGDMGIYTHKRFVLRARALMHFRRYSEALTCLDSALRASPNYGPALMDKARVLRETDRIIEAVEYYRLASEDVGCYRPAMSALASLYLDQGKPQEAANLLFQAWIKDPANLISWVEWRQLCERSGNPAMVLECYEQLAAHQPMTAELLVDWGRELASVGRSGEAIQRFAEAMKLQPTYANSYFNCGDLMLKAGMADRSVEMYKAGLALSPQHADGWFVLGNALARCEFYDDSMLAFQKALELDPSHRGAAHNLQQLRAA